MPDGETVVLVHGFRGDHHGLEPLARHISVLSPRHRLIIPDLPAFGETPALTSGGSEATVHDLAAYGGWLSAFASEVAPDGYAILGHSFGSLVVANALSTGMSPRGTILINPIASPALEGPQALLTQLAIAYYRLGEILPERIARKLLGNALIVRGMSEVMAKTREPGLRGWIHGQHAQYFSRFSDTTSLLEAFQASVSHTVFEYADSFTSATLLIAGERDDITPLHRQLDLHRRVPGSRFRIMPGVGHLIHYEAYHQAAEEILVFLADLERSTQEVRGEASGE